MRLQAEIDDALRARFACPTPPSELIAELRDAASKPVRPHCDAGRTTQVEPRGRRESSWSGLAVAASLLLVAGTLLATRGLDSLTALIASTPESSYARRHVTDVYDRIVASGFRPDWFCEDEKRFADTFAERQGQGVWLRPLPDGVRMVGLAYPPGLTRSTTAMLARVDDRPVLLLVERTERLREDQLHDRPHEASLFRRQFGDLTAIEVTPLGEPRLLQSIYLADPPEQPTGRVPGA